MRAEVSNSEDAPSSLADDRQAAPTQVDVAFRGSPYDERAFENCSMLLQNIGQLSNVCSEVSSSEHTASSLAGDRQLAPTRGNFAFRSSPKACSEKPRRKGEKLQSTRC